MPWNKDIESTDAYKMYSTLIKIKTTSPAFCDGGFKVLWDEGYVFSFARFTPEEVYLTVCSSDTKESEVILPIDIFGSDFAKMKLPEKDVLENSLNGEIKNGNLHLKVPAEKSYLIKLSLN